MKKIIIIAVLGFSILGFGQKLKDFGAIGGEAAGKPSIFEIQKVGGSPNSIFTNEKEYNYLTKGLKTQIDSGLDVIAGYSFNKLSERAYGNYTFNSNYLMLGTTVKALSVIITNRQTNKRVYLCLPINNEILELQYATQTYTLDAITMSYLARFYADSTQFFANYVVNK